MTGIELLLLFCFISVGYCQGYIDDDTYEIYIRYEKGKITKEKLTTNKNVSFLEIMFTKVTSIEPDSFCAIPNVKTIRITGNKMFPKITKQLFQCTPELSVFTIAADPEANQEIERDALTDLKNLNSLEMRYVNIGRVGKDMFVGFNLELLILVSCSITEIDADSFSGMPNLEELELGHNLIESFKPGTFKNLPNLKKLYLNKNEISEIKWDQWDILPSLEFIDFGDNPLVKCDVSKIKEYFPVVQTCNLGNSFNATQKAAMIEESERFNVSIKFKDYYSIQLYEIEEELK
ncbi:hypothetical protein WA026_023568 [Henosepilachna vigintioctopunctata]|uniref:Uncharacterized protein n=1 Tax=Henosepilachna vigintioctopunctata TaxID=420089 RepID=A0AAW1VHW1_9CUCU